MKQHAIPLKDVIIEDGFFSHYADLVRQEVIPYQWEALNDRVPGAEKSGCIQNFKNCRRGGRRGFHRLCISG